MMHDDAAKVLGQRLASVRAVFFDGRGDKKYSTVKRLALNFGAERIVFGINSYGELFTDAATS